MKHKFINRVLSLILALVCVMGVLPLSAFAAEGLSSAPGSITQRSSDYMKIGGRSVRYKAASSVINNVGLPYVFDEQVDVPGFGPTRALCAYQKGTLGPGANGQTWDFKEEVNNASLRVLLTYVYSHTYPAILEGEAVRGDEVLAGQPGFPDGVPGKAELLSARGVEHLVEDGQPLIAVERVRPDAQHLEISQDIRLHPFQPGLGRFQALRLHAEGDVLGLGQAIVAFGKLIFEHIRVFLPDTVVGVNLLRDANGPLVFLHVGALVEEGELDVDGAVKVVEEVTVILKNPVLVLILGQLIIDVVKTNLLGVVAICHHTDPVPAHLPVGDGLLGGLGEPAVQLGLLHGGHQPPLVWAGQLGLRGEPDGVPQVGLICFVPLFCCAQIFCLCFLLLCLQLLSPPFLFGSAAPGRRTGFRCGRGGSGVPGTAPG